MKLDLWTKMEQITKNATNKLIPIAKQEALKSIKRDSKDIQRSAIFIGKACLMAFILLESLKDSPIKAETSSKILEGIQTFNLTYNITNNYYGGMENA